MTVPADPPEGSAPSRSTRLPSGTSRAQARERTMARILALGRAQLVERGPAELSVREIARGLGMVSSAIYRYVDSRDALLTLLITDAFTELADGVDAALDQAALDQVALDHAALDPAGSDRAGPGPRTRFLALAGTMTAWALAHPERWTLLYGTPVRGYAAPAESTTAPGTRVMARLLEIAADAADARTGGAATGADAATDAGADAPQPLPAGTSRLLEDAAAELGVDVPPEVALRAVAAWSALVGIISAHVFGQLGPDAVAVGEELIGLEAQIVADLICPR